MAETVRCPVCGASNPDTLERCRACNQLLKQSTSELSGFGDRIASGQTPIEKKTSELEKALPAWLRRARQIDQDNPEAPEETPEAEMPSTSEPEADALVFPDFSVEEEDEEDVDVNPLDWLAALDESGEDEEDEAESADWLVNLQGDLAPEEPQPAAQVVSAVDEPVTANIPPAPSEEAAHVDGEEFPEWISNLQGDSQISTDDFPDLIPDGGAVFDVESAATSDDAGLPDWLSRLSDEAEASGGTSTPAPASAPLADAAPAADTTDDSLPDWMTELQGAGEVSGVEPPVVETSSVESASDDLPAWFSGAESATSEAAPAESGSDLPAWMSGPQSEEEAAPAAASDDLPDWLSGAEPASEIAPAEAGSALTDWMSGLQAAEESTPVLKETPDEASDDLPNWMASLQGTEETASVQASDDLPDWMSNSQGAEETEPVQASDTLPDWMANLQGQDEQVVEASVAEPESESVSAFMGVDLPEAGDDLPEWMASLQGADEMEDASFPTDIFAAEASSQESVAPLWNQPLAEAADDIPDWLSRVGKPTTDSLSADGAGLSPVQDAADEAPEWLRALPVIDDDAQKEVIRAELPSSSAFIDRDTVFENDETDEIFGIEMPDWLSSLGPDASGVVQDDVEDAPPAREEDLSGVELPSWVQAMRPVASVVSDLSRDSEHSEEHVVAATGPLAGLSGILPVGTGTGSKNKPRAHAVKLRVSESQQSGAALLERILASEAEATPRQVVDASASVPLLRWIVAALMIFVVGGMLFTSKEIIPSPNIAIPEIGAAVNIINQLPAEGAALLVFDYEAGLSAEMQAAAAPLVDHLMLRGLKLAFLSTTPNGPVLAERFLKETQSQHMYQPGDDYLNLGYLPGGASGILSFVSSPRFAVTGRFNGASFWDYAPLSGISRITDFAVVVVLTDDVEKGRTWIEQASVPLNDSSIPFLMAISAQAEPIIYPYYASTQLDGLVSGLAGGATYERLQGQNGLGRKYWDAYGMGLFAAEILIVFGAVLNFIAGLAVRQKLEKEEE